jgi:hypothetical protein
LKLYNIFESIILEEMANTHLLNESVSIDAVNDAIENKYNVNITYDDYPDAEIPVAPSKRYIQVYDYADTKANNAAIRAYQIFGGSKTTPKSGAWKIFRLDRIRSWQPTTVKFARPIQTKAAPGVIPPFNPSGDKTMSTVHNIVDFNKNKLNKNNSNDPNASKSK